MIKKLLVFIIFLIIIIILTKIALDSTLIVKTYTIETKKVTNPIRILFIADLHSVYFGAEQNELIKNIEEQKPDIILLGGDIADNHIPHIGTMDLLESISEDYPCYYVSGNHEYWSGEIDRIKELIQGYGVTILEGERSTIVANSQIIQICGIDDPEVGEEIFSQQMEQAFQDIDTNIYTVFLTHRPERIEQYINYPSDLILSGHTHGGQWRIPYILNGLYAPNQGYFPKYSGGLYKLKNTNMIISRGLKNKVRKYPRIFNPSELVLIELLPESQD